MIVTIFKWSGLFHLLIRVRVVNLQVPMPMPMPMSMSMPMFAMPQPMPQIFAIPPPPPVAVPVPIPIPVPVQQPTTTSTSTTTTTEQNMGMAVPIPMPIPIQIAIPAMPPPVFCQTNQANQAKPRPKNCPPCPPCVCAPSCTPAFFSFCSPCHQKCRCRKREDVPEPMPPRPPQPLLAPAFPMAVPMAPMMGPPPMVFVPYPLRRGRGRRPWNEAPSSEDSCSSSSSEWGMGRRSGRRHNKRFSRNHRRKWRRNNQDDEKEAVEDELVKPVLTYISNDGEIKLKRRISADEAARLLDERESGGKSYQTVRVLAGQNAAKQSQVMVVSDDGEEPRIAHRQKQVVLRRGASQHIIGEGKKELVFRPPDDKTISNLSVSFQVI